MDDQRTHSAAQESDALERWSVLLKLFPRRLFGLVCGGMSMNAVHRGRFRGGYLLRHFVGVQQYPVPQHEDELHVYDVYR